MIRKCKACGKEFKTYKKTAKFCSMKCYNPVLKIEKKCKVCGKKFKVYRHLQNTAKFCSSKCYWESLKGRKLLEKTIEKMKKPLGEKAYNWKGGKYKGNNRWYIKKSKHPHSINGKTLDKDCVAEISANSVGDAHEEAMKIFDGKFHNCTKELPDLYFYPRGIIKI